MNGRAIFRSFVDKAVCKFFICNLSG